MKEQFKIITDAFEKSGIDVRTAEYSITTYSLNTDLSFKFSNIDEFLEFLNLTGPGDEARTEKINSLFVDHGVDPSNFFYVNFYPPKVVEM